ncbi:UNVERIFIED_CONTAM: Stabilin-2 [Siphonaria sp. JEL0065]|nr:Stabilin-2 [Siphonaria sp. JEL0065]
MSSFSGTEWLVTLEGSEVLVSGSSGSHVLQLVGTLGSIPSNVITSAQFDGGIVHFVDLPLSPPSRITEIASSAIQLSSFLDAIKKVGLTETISSLNRSTIFAPTNAAFSAISRIANTLSTEQFKQVLLLHVIQNQVIHSTAFSRSTGLLAGNTIGGIGAIVNLGDSLTGQFDSTTGNVLVNGPGNTDGAATVLVPDVLGSNGIVMHVIDKVLLPDTIIGGGNIGEGGAAAVEGGSGGEKTAEGGNPKEERKAEGMMTGETKSEVKAPEGTSGEGTTSKEGSNKEATTGGTSNLVEMLTANKANMLLSLVKENAPILQALSTFQGTIFAPTDDALAATLASGFDAKNLTAVSQVLKYHVVPGTVFASTSFSGTAFLTTLTGDEIQASGSSASTIQLSTAFGSTMAKVVKSVPFNRGIIHFIDTTLTPPTGIVAIAKQANLNALLTAITNVGLADTVMSLSNATVFAPSDTAFAAIASTTSKLSTDQLKKVLLLHVVPNNRFHSTEFMQAKTIPSIPTAEMENLSAQFDGTTVRVKGPGNSMGGKVVTADVLAMNNVVVHVIDQVLLPGSGSGFPVSKAVGLSSFGAVLAFCLGFMI